MIQMATVPVLNKSLQESQQEKSLPVWEAVRGHVNAALTGLNQTPNVFINTNNSDYRRKHSSQLETCLAFKVAEYSTAPVE